AAVKICLWTKRSILGEGVCYKQKFYGINCHQCMQMTPCVPFCNHACVFCWRDNTIHRPDWEGDVDAPSVLLDECIQGQRALLTGFGGNTKADARKFKEAQDPKHVAISLDGEPTLYPLLPELIGEAHSRKLTTFLVTNGGNPEMIRKLDETGSLPTQLYVSVSAPDEKTFKRVIIPLKPSGWNKFNESLALLPELDTRTTYRITLVKGCNDSNLQGYMDLIEKGKPDFIEVKAYMALGKSRDRLGLIFMPEHAEVKERRYSLRQNPAMFSLTSSRSRAFACSLKTRRPRGKEKSSSKRRTAFASSRGCREQDRKSLLGAR
ncbi:MAG: 4-demethylwyosine synthase TYW1, partial [Candidatus Micrarchaeota archaeon]